MPAPFHVDDERPFAQRHDGMSLDIVRPKDIPRGKVLYPKDEDRALKTDDIHRGRPHYDHLNYLEKPDLCVGSTDPVHAGGRARSYYPCMDRRPRDLSLTTVDIELAQPKGVRSRGNRHVDPVCPNYELPSCHLRPVTPPRWNGRHTNHIGDIERANPKVLHPDRNYSRNPNDAADIEYASPNYEGRVKRPLKEDRLDRTLNVKDITHTKRAQTRCTDPLDPVYKLPTTSGAPTMRFSEEHGMDHTTPAPMATHVGEVHGSKPRKLHWDNGEPQLSLLREDIAGTVPQRWVGAVPFNIYDPHEVKPVVTFHDPHDIPGAQVGSLKKGIEGSRRAGSTNPLNPRYRMPGGDPRPQPCPVLPGERGAHPLAQARLQSSSASAPDLHTGVRSPMPGSALPTGRSSASGMTPIGSLQSGRGSMRREASAGSLRLGGKAALDSGASGPRPPPIRGLGAQTAA